MSGNIANLQPRDLKELDKVLDYAYAKDKCVQELSKDFEDASCLKLFWDSKIPENDKWFFYFFSLTPVDRSYVLNELKKYHEFYEELNTEISKMKTQEDPNYEENKNILENLHKKLLKMIDDANHEKNTTPSSTICNLHKSFIWEQEEMEDLIKNAKLIVMTKGWKKSTKQIQDLQERLGKSEEKMDKMRDCLKKISSQNEEFLNEKKNFIETSNKMQEQQEKFLKTIKEMKKDHEEALLENDKKVQEQQEKFLKTIKEMKKEHEEALLENNKKMKDQQTVLLECIAELKQQQAFLLEEVRMSRQPATDENGTRYFIS